MKRENGKEKGVKEKTEKKEKNNSNKNNAFLSLILKIKLIKNKSPFYS